MLAWLDAYSGTILNGFALAAVLFIIAVGLSLVFGTMDVLNLAHGAISLAGAYVGVAMVSDGGSVAAFFLAVLVAAAIGLALGGLLAAMTAKVAGHLRQALLTLGVALIAGELIAEIFGSDVKRVRAPEALSGSTEVFGNAYPVYRLAMVAIGIVVAVALYLLLERTRLGAVVRATVADRDMVEAIGIRTTFVLGGVFAGGGALAAAGGLLAAPVLGAQPGLDDTVLLLALVVVVIGGLGSLRGALLGAVLVGQVQVLGVALLPEIASFLLFGGLALVLLLRPGGLLPAPGRQA